MDTANRLNDQGRGFLFLSNTDSSGYESDLSSSESSEISSSRSTQGLRRSSGLVRQGGNNRSAIDEMRSRVGQTVAIRSRVLPSSDESFLQLQRATLLTDAHFLMAREEVASNVRASEPNGPVERSSEAGLSSSAHGVNRVQRYFTPAQ